MKYLRLTVFIAFVLTLALFVVYEDYLSRHADDTIPTIVFDTDALALPVTSTEADLLSGVYAYDEKDGDLTDHVIVERVSNFTETGVASVTYAVVDDDLHVVKARRALHYTDYRAPRFSFHTDMRFEAGAKFNLLDIIGADDLIDGDISAKVKLISSELNASVPGVYKCQAQVTSSMGDVSYLEFNVTIYEAHPQPIRIELSEYLVYLNAGDAFDPASYYRGDQSPRIVSGVNTDEPGQYKVYYHLDTPEGATGVAELFVIVEE